MKRALQSLAMGKQSQRILCRKGFRKDIGLFFSIINFLNSFNTFKFLEPTDEFSVNDAFTSKLTRIKIQLVSGRGDTEPERKEIRSKVCFKYHL